MATGPPARDEGALGEINKRVPLCHSQSMSCRIMHFAMGEVDLCLAVLLVAARSMPSMHVQQHA